MRRSGHLGRSLRKWRSHRRCHWRRALPRPVGFVDLSRSPYPSIFESLIPNSATLAVTAAIFSMAISVAVTVTVGGLTSTVPVTISATITAAPTFAVPVTGADASPMLNSWWSHISSQSSPRLRRCGRAGIASPSLMRWCISKPRVAHPRRGLHQGCEICDRNVRHGASSVAPNRCFGAGATVFFTAAIRI